MKNRVLSAALKSTAIVLMLLSAFAIAFPLMRVINGKLYQLENYALTQLEEKTGLSLSYESLSPAILSGLNFKGIDISDPETETILLHLDSVRVSYRLWPLIHGDISGAIGGVTVNGLEFRFNDEKNMKVVDRLMDFISGLSGNEEKEAEKSGFIMPFPVTLKDCTFVVEARGMSGSLELDSITLKSSSYAPYTTNVETKGSLSFIPDDTLTQFIPKLTTDLRIQAHLTPDLNGTFGRFELKKAEGGAFSFKDVEFAAGLADKRLSLSMFTPDAPYGVEAWWDMETGAVHAELNATDFDPFTVVSVKTRQLFVKKVSGGRIDGRFTFDGFLPDGGGMPYFTYNVDGSMYLPPGILEDELSVSVAAAGDLYYVSVDDLQVSTEPFSLNYYGDVDIAGMNLNGYLKLGHYLLPSGKTLSGEFYFDDVQSGFSAFSPMLMLGDVGFTAVELDCIPGDGSADIILEAYDYTHTEADSPGVIMLDGSFLYSGSQYLQGSISLQNMYADNLLRYAENVLPPESKIDPALYETLAPYILSCDVYGSTDFSSVSFNVPYAVVANTTKDGEMLLLSVDGNETNIQVSQLEVLYAGQELSATISADSNEDYSQISFYSNLVVNGIPYGFSGSYVKGKEILVNGDYSLELMFNLQVKNEIQCSVNTNLLPVKLGDYVLTFTLDSEVDFSSLEDFFITVNNLEVAESSEKIAVKPNIKIAGYANRDGMQLNTLDYDDTVSLILGKADASWVISKTDFTSLNLNLNMSNDIGKETILLNVDAFADTPVPLTEKDFFKKLNIDGTAELNSIMLAHFIENQGIEDKVTVNASVLGDLSNPFVTLNVDEMLMHAAGFPINARASFLLDDKLLMGSDINCSYQAFKVQDFGFDLSLEEKTGEGWGVLDVNMDKTVTATSPIHFDLGMADFVEEDGEQKAGIDLKKANYWINLVFDDIQSSFGPEIKDYKVNLMHDEGIWTLTAGPTDGITGWLLDSGEFGLSAVADFPILFNATSTFTEKALDVTAENISGDLSILKYFLNDQFSVEGGKFTGDLHIGGTFMDPDFYGSLNVEDLTLLMPAYISEPMIAPEVTLTADETTFSVHDALFNVGNGQAIVDLSVEMDGWRLSEINVSVKSANKTRIPAHFNIAYADCVADADVNLNVNITGNDIAITGDISVYNGLVELHTGGGEDEPEAMNSGGSVYIDLSISMNQKAELYYPDKENPLIRGLVITQEPVRLVMDSDTADISVTGSLALRGGEILYLNRNFYLREGSLELNETGGDFDPRISFRAEIRERDAEGETVKINLSADRQKLSQLSPVLSSTPNKTEDELRLMLGAALIADSGSTPGEVLASVAASGFDFLLQNSLFRQLENRLRDLCNFDIFSFRTPFIQQALLSAMNNSEEPTSLGNFFDNTTVYIGKYIGNTIYLDAMFRFVYQENNSGGGLTQRLAFQPEVGLELPSPFATIRWSIAPDITSAKNLWVPYTSISLSWSFKF